MFTCKGDTVRYILVLLTAFLFIGCATKNYGRHGLLTDYEKETLTCREIKLEISKLEGFINYVSESSTTIDGREILAFLGDLGIGNAIEASAARESATNRIAQLHELSVYKECPDVSGYFKKRYSKDSNSTK